MQAIIALIGLILITDTFSHNTDIQLALVKIMHLSHPLVDMITPKALTQLNVTDCYGSDLNVSMNQNH